MPDRPTVLFLCVHNAGRSQMAAAFAEAWGEGSVRVLSAGSEPAESLNPAVVAAMAERGLDLAGRTPTRVTDAMARESDVVVTMGCGDACPFVPGVRYLDWPVADPAGRSIEEVRAIRDEIAARVEDLLEELTRA